MSNTANVKEQISRTLLALLVAVLSPSVAWSDFAPEPLGDVFRQFYGIQRVPQVFRCGGIVFSE